MRTFFTCSLNWEIRRDQLEYMCACVSVMNVEQASISSWVTGAGVCDFQHPKSVVLYSPMRGHGPHEGIRPALDVMQDKRKIAFPIIGVGSIAQEEFLEMRFYLPSPLVVRLHAY